LDGNEKVCGGNYEIGFNHRDGVRGLFHVVHYSSTGEIQWKGGEPDMGSSITLHALFRSTQRHIDLHASEPALNLPVIGQKLSDALSIVKPIVQTAAPLKFRFGGRSYSANNGRIKTEVRVGGEVFIVGLTPFGAPTIVTAWKE
jgi:hypothetical protein